MSGLRRLRIIGLGGLVLLAVLGSSLLVRWAPGPGGAAGTAGSSGAGPADYGRVPEFSLVERSGRPVGLGDLRGLVWVADFIYTECPDTCPLQSTALARLQAEFADAQDLRLVSITIDPEHDTPAVLTRYARRFGAGDRWLFLTGTPRQTRCLATRGFHLAVNEPGGPPVDCDAALHLGPAPAWAHEAGGPRRFLHGARLVVVDGEARIRAYREVTDPSEMSRLHDDLRSLLAASTRARP